MTLSPEIKRRLDAWWDDAGEMARLTPRVKKNDFAAIVAHVAHEAMVSPPRRKPTKQLKGLSRDLGLSMAFISHDLSVIRAVCDRVYVLQSGRIVEEGFCGHVFDAPREGRAYTRPWATQRFGRTTLPQQFARSAGHRRGRTPHG